MGMHPLFRLPDGTVAYLRMHTTGEIIADKGLDPGGDAQAFHTQNVLRRIIKYMPCDSGMTMKVTIAQTDINKPYIITNTPYARFLYHGKVMVGDITGRVWAMKDEPKHEIDRDLIFNREVNPMAGPYWDRALKANEEAVMVRELQAFIDSRKRR